MIKRILFTAVTAILPLTAQAADGSALARRLTAVGFCASQLHDYTSTAKVIAAGGRESNWLIAPNGHFKENRLIGLKAGICALALVGEEIPHLGHWKSARSWDHFFMATNVAGAAAMEAVAFHNRDVLHRQYQINDAARAKALANAKASDIAR